MSTNRFTEKHKVYSQSALKRHFVTHLYSQGLIIVFSVLISHTSFATVSSNSLCQHTVLKVQSTSKNFEILNILTSKPLRTSAKIHNEDVYEILSFQNGIKAIKKPHHFGGKSNAYNEVDAYVISEILGLNLVPPTVELVVDGLIFSAQQYKNGHPANWLGSPLEGELLLQYERMRIFDYLINNQDRHDYNYLIENNQIHAIDHGVSFQPEVNGLGDHPAPALESLNLVGHDRLLESLQDQLTPEKIRTLLNGRHSETVINEILQRRAKILNMWETQRRI